MTTEKALGPVDEDVPILSETERLTLLEGALRGVAPDSLTTEQLARVVAWAEQARIDGILLDHVLGGEVVATFKRGNVVFIARHAVVVKGGDVS